MSRISEIINELNNLANGYISVKTIKGRKYYYLQFLENGKLKSKYIKKENLIEIKKQLARRKVLENELQKITSVGRSLPKLSKTIRKLSGYLMMGDVVVAIFDNGICTYYHEKLCPILIKRTKNISSFLSSRVIDASRTNAHLLKKALQIIDESDEMISLYAHSATITDNYWFKSFKSKLKYKDISFDGDTYSDLALNGELIAYPKVPKTTPELTTPGSFEKCWKRINDEWWLYKKGSENEIYSELFCAKVCEALKIPTAKYEYIDGYIRTKNFADKYNFEPMYSLAGDDDSYENVFNKLNELCPDFAKEYLLLIWFDTIVNNVDRHNENCGFLRNKKNGFIYSLAPNFDNNLALISRNETLNTRPNKDGFMRYFVNFIGNNDDARKYYKTLKLPKLTAKMISDCFKKLPYKKDEKLITNYVMGRYEYLLSLQKKI
ncbi:MAG: HipA domain-containing protein [Erysipelotrichaceae bacterium]|nr:HipA domain-containing protein [Erysipelotrichaceae bacterium]